MGWIKPYRFGQIVYQKSKDLEAKLSDYWPIAVTLDIP